MHNGGHICQCDFPKYRHVDSWTCESTCPTGTIVDSTTRVCEPQGVQELDVSLTFDNQLPVFNTVTASGKESISSVHADSCRPPKALAANRGSYFSGKENAEYIQLHNFELTNTHTIKMWVKAEAGDASLASFTADLFDGWSSYKNWNCS
jgi:hypothetical protein